jgi:transcriptional regulator with XRE-family HTH domain
MHRKHLRKRRLPDSFDFPQAEAANPDWDFEAEIGHSVRDLREARGLSQRALADRSGLSVNTISLIENEKSSPSVSTLQKISAALNVPLIAFFLTDQVEKKVTCTREGKRVKFAFECGTLEDLGEGLSEGFFQPIIVTLDPKASSGIDPIIHTGYEFVFCLKGRIAYIIENTRYVLGPGDSLFFESHLPHCWQNLDAGSSQKLLVLCPSDEHDRPFERHFTPQ